jgi:mannose-1-phosphate guanylyltransferase
MIALIGVKPTMSTTSYGYIEYDSQMNYNGVHKVTRFHEKPDHRTAQDYFMRSEMLWNISVFAGRLHIFLQEFEACAAHIFDPVCQYHNTRTPYDVVPSLSIDYAVIEKSKLIWVFPAEFAWNDVGTVATFVELKNKASSRNEGQVISIDASNNLVDVPNKLVALVGVDNLCIIQTDDALLIVRVDDTEKIRAVVSYLRSAENLKHYL